MAASKYRRLNDPNSLERVDAPKTALGDDLLFGSLDETSSSAGNDFVAAIRSCNGLGNISDTKQFDSVLRSKLSGKMVTLANMANSDYLKRLDSARRTPASADLIGSKEAHKQGLYDIKKLTRSDIELLHSMWIIYARAFMTTITSIRAFDVPDDISIAEYQHSLLVDNFELVGASIDIVHSSNPQLMSVRGIVAEEGQNTFHVVTSAGKHLIMPKSVITFSVFLSDSNPLEKLTLFGPDFCTNVRSNFTGMTGGPKTYSRTRNSFRYT